MNDDPDLEVELVRGGGGVFDVSVDGKVLFSKHKLGRFPAPGEILSMLQARRENTGDIQPTSHLADRDASSVDQPSSARRSSAPRGGTCATDCCSTASGEV